MPFTPYHLGPGAAFKAIGGKRFSFMVFGGAQVLIDIEVLARMLGGTAVLHGFSHTIAGAAIIGLVATVTGKPVSEVVLKAFGVPDFRITWAASAWGAFVGTFSHIVLDGLIYADMEPGYPLTTANPLLRLLSFNEVYVLCLALGVLGVVVILARRRASR